MTKEENIRDILDLISEYQEGIRQSEQRISEEKEQIKEDQIMIDTLMSDLRALCGGNLPDEDQEFGGYRMIKQIEKGKPRRVVDIDAIKELNPDIFFSAGTFRMCAGDIPWTPEKKTSYLRTYNFGANWEISLAELDKVVGGKKYSEPFTTTEQKTTVKYVVVAD